MLCRNLLWRTLASQMEGQIHGRTQTHAGACYLWAEAGHPIVPIAGAISPYLWMAGAWMPRPITLHALPDQALLA